jgi:hypothetical protein
MAQIYVYGTPNKFPGSKGDVVGRFTETHLPKEDGIMPIWLAFSQSAAATVQATQGDIDPRCALMTMHRFVNHTMEVDKRCNLSHVKEIISCWTKNPRLAINSLHTKTCEAGSAVYDRSEWSVLHKTKVCELSDPPGTQASDEKFGELLDKVLKPYCNVVLFGDYVEELNRTGCDQEVLTVLLKLLQHSIQ